MSIIFARNNVETTPIKIGAWLAENPLPIISMRRYPHPEWYEDSMLTVLTFMMGFIMMLSFLPPCLNTIKAIATEKEKQLKVSKEAKLLIESGRFL